MNGVPSWDLFLFLFIIMGVVYGFILQKDRVVVTMLAIYVALVATTILVSPVQQFFAGEKAFFNQVFIRSNANSFSIQTIIFLGVIALVSAKSGLSGRDSGAGTFELLAFSFLNATLILSSIIFFMLPEQRNGIIEGSRIARLLVSYHTWWLILPLVLLIITGWRKSSD